MAEELANLAALRYAPTPQKPAPQNAVEATAAVSLRAKAAVPQSSLAYDVASPADAQLWKRSREDERETSGPAVLASCALSVVQSRTGHLDLRQDNGRVRQG